MIRLIKSDIYRVLNARSFWIIMAILLVLQVLLILDGGIFYIGPTNSESTYRILNDTRSIKETLHGSTLNINIFVMFASVLYAVIVGHEFSNGTYKNILCSGINRISFVVGKLISISIMLVLMLIYWYSLAFIISLIMNGTSISFLTMTDIKYLIFSIVITTLILTTINAVALMLQFFLNSVVVPMTIVTVAPVLISLFIILKGAEGLSFLDLTSTLQYLIMGDTESINLTSCIIKNIALLIGSTGLASYIMTKREF